MPLPPSVDPNRRIDPRHDGDGRAVQPPRWRSEKPWGRQDGRMLPPDRTRIGDIDRDDVRGDIRGVEGRWDRNDHGYDWHRWNGMDVCHHYDAFGYHWWGFYVGGTYFWTRWHADRYWWYDPYWHRWVWLENGRWWWQDAGAVYVVVDGDYYRYRDADGTVVMTPDPTPPVDLPPSDPNAPQPGQTAFFSQDGTRSVLILGDARDAYLYDLSVTDPNDARGQGRWLASGVTSVAFRYQDRAAADGTTTKVLRQVDLSFDDPLASAAADPNGERLVRIEGADRAATLYDLTDDAVAPTDLARGVSAATLFDEETQDASGETVQKLTMISLAATDAAGRPISLLFSRDGVSYGSASRPAGAQSLRTAAPPAAPKIDALRARMKANPALRALESGAGWR
jgi:hypothetical protein